MSRIYNPDLPIIKEGWEGNLFNKGKFTNGRARKEKTPFTTVLKWQLSKNPQREEKKNENFQLQIG